MTSIASTNRCFVPGGPAMTSGRVRFPTRSASRIRNGRPPKWSPCRWLMRIASIFLGSTPKRFIALSEEAPQSMRNRAAADRTKKHVWWTGRI